MMVVTTSMFVGSWCLNFSNLESQLFHPDIHVYAAYDESYDSDSIFVFGGWEHPNSSYKYSILNDKIIDYDSLDIGGFTWGRPGAVMIDNLIYYGASPVRTTDPAILAMYDVETKIQSVLYTSNDGNRIYCVQKHPNNPFIYFVDGEMRFYVYNISNQQVTLITNGTYDRNAPTCIVNDYFETPYFYILLGDNVFVERIRLDNNLTTNSFEIVNNFTGGLFNQTLGSSVDFSQPFRIYNGINFENLIFLINGYNGDSVDGAENEMFYYNVVTNKFQYIGEFIDTRHFVGAVLATHNNKIYTFGGSIFYIEEYYTDLTTISQSNPIVPIDTDYGSKNEDSWITLVIVVGCVLLFILILMVLVILCIKNYRSKSDGGVSPKINSDSAVINTNPNPNDATNGDPQRRAVNNCNGNSDSENIDVIYGNDKDVLIAGESTANDNQVEGK